MDNFTLAGRQETFTPHYVLVLAALLIFMGVASAYQFGANNFNGTGTMKAGQFNVSDNGYINSNSTCTRMCFNSSICMMIGSGC
jgi:ABC-type uncharacterized transport system permease subunit